jgi:hypothetical protein
MAGISSFSLSWWYSANTRLAITFQTLAGTISGDSLERLDYTNGLSASVEEDYRLENQITNHPVEAGVSISDHIIPQPKIISITAMLTAIQTLQIAGFSTGEGVLNFNQLGQAIKFLFDSYDQRTLFTLTTGLYFGRGFFQAKSLAIQSINIPRNNQYGRTSIKVGIVFKEVIVTDPYAKSSPSQTSQGQLDPNISGPE